MSFLIALGLVLIEMSSLFLKCFAYYSVVSFHILLSCVNNTVGLKPNTYSYLSVFLTVIRIYKYLVFQLFDFCVHVFAKCVLFGKKRRGVFPDQKGHHLKVAKNLLTEVPGSARLLVPVSV